MNRADEPPLILGLSHIAIAVPRLSEVGGWLSMFSSSEIQTYSSDEQAVNVMVLQIEGLQVELMEPAHDESTISRFLDANPRGGLHHICFYVSDLEVAVRTMKDKGVRSITRGLQNSIMHGAPISFFNPRDLNGVLVEFEEIR